MTIDLGSSQQLSRVKLSWETAYGKSYKVQASADGSSWTDLYSTTTGTGTDLDQSLNGTGRYVRMLGTERGTQWGYSLWSFDVYGY